MRNSLLVVTLLALAIAAAPGIAAAPPSAPVRAMPASGFGSVLATKSRQALYWWAEEKRDFKVHCTGACAEAWPPLIVRSAKVARTVYRIKGVFGTIRRPDGRLQLTWNRLPVYTYAHEGPGQVLCDNVDGWFVVRQ